jgi:hypothetical protein
LVSDFVRIAHCILTKCLFLDYLRDMRENKEKTPRQPLQISSMIIKSKQSKQYIYNAYNAATTFAQVPVSLIYYIHQNNNRFSWQIHLNPDIFISLSLNLRNKSGTSSSFSLLIKISISVPMANDFTTDIQDGRWFDRSKLSPKPPIHGPDHGHFLVG